MLGFVSVFIGVVPLYSVSKKMDFQEVDGKKAGLTTGLLVANDFTAEH